MLAENRTFWVRGEDGQEYGPVELEELRDWTRENRAGLGTLVRLDEPNAIWQPWQHHPELVALLAEVHVTSPVPGRPGLVIAPLSRRFLAALLDLILSEIPASILFHVVIVSMKLPDWQDQFWAAVLHPENPVSPQLLYESSLCNLIASSILVLYLAGCHALYGRTPGKALLSIRVVEAGGQNPPFFRSLFRALIFVVCLNFIFPLVYVFLNPQRRAFHDVICGTYVVRS